MSVDTCGIAWKAPRNDALHAAPPRIWPIHRATSPSQRNDLEQQATQLESMASDLSDEVRSEIRSVAVSQHCGCMLEHICKCAIHHLPLDAKLISGAQITAGGMQNHAKLRHRAEQVLAEVRLLQCKLANAQS